MICTVKIKLLPSAEQRQQLLATMHRFNEACNFASKVAWENKAFGQVRLHKLCYYAIRSNFGLSAQFAVRVIGKVTESYKVDKKRLHTFKPTGAVVLDDRLLSFHGLDTASILTVDGRIKVPMIVGDYQKGVMSGRRIRNQADLVLVDNTFYLLLAVELPDGAPIETKDFLGVDLGITNLAADSDGETYSGGQVNGLRRRYAKLRAKLQKKGTKSAKRLLKKRRHKEQRFVRDVNHCISKRLVAKAKGTGRGIALEDLTGIRDRVTVRKAQRRSHHSWAFYQLRSFIEYKARLAGVPVVLVDPRNTSRTCPECGTIDKRNRPDRDHFHCVSCGFAGPADTIAAVNVRRRAVVNQPYAEPKATA